jgi:hypothetical protein
MRFRMWHAGLLALLLFATAGTQADEIDYTRDIKPVLKAKCFSCHASIEQEADLRLDTVAAMVAGGDSGATLIPGDSAASLLLQRVAANDPLDRMPPDGEPMSPDQIARLRQWIEAGATRPADESPQPDPQSHWSFQPVRPVTPPAISAHPIDGFVRRRLAEANIRPAPPADVVTLVRRMFLDLHGLPPSPEQVAEWSRRFERDRRQSVALIDELLSSPHYGERWAQHWLDVIRYADTHGYEVNTPRPNAWPYRDYVIKSLNDDKPYDQFIREQLAGDAFGHDAATGFLVAAAALLPGQIGKDDASIRLARQDALDEIIVGTSATFLAMTVGCARCHDHKFDPIPQEDYYAMQAFFAGVDYGERELRDEGFQQRFAQANELQPAIDRLRSHLLQNQPRFSSGRTIIIDDEDLQRVTLLKTKKGHGENPAGAERGYRDDVGDGSRMGNLSRGRYTWFENVPGEDVFTWDPKTEGTFRLWISWGVHGSGVHTRDARYVLDRDGDLATRDDQREIASADQYRFAGVSDGESEQQPLWSGLHDCGVHEFSASTRLVLRGGRTSTSIAADVIVLQQQTADEEPPNASLPQLRGPVSPQKTDEHFSAVPAKFVRFTSLETIDDNRHEPCIDELELFTAGDAPNSIGRAQQGTKPTSSGNYSETGIHQLAHINDGRFGNSHSWISNQLGRGWVQLELPEVVAIDRISWSRDREGKFKDRLPVKYQISASIDGSQWTIVASSDDRVPLGTPHDDIQSLVRNAGISRNTKQRDIESLADAASQLRQLEQQQVKLRKPQLVYAGQFRDTDTTFVLRRGDPEQPTREIAPRVLTALGSLCLPETAAEQDRRTALADWIASADNPLTARVIANRIWQYHFGVGLVETPSDFGLGGQRPSHPDLLDWLSGELVRSGWSLKHLHRLIMSSETYAQSSRWSTVDRHSRTTSESHPASVDANCKLLWRFPSRRLEAEAIRDCILHVSGHLNLAMGGPGFDFFKTRGGLSGFPPVEQFDASGLRRMIYAHKIRMEPVPIFGAFDCPDAGLPTPMRGQSTTAIQALNLFNSPFVLVHADAFAARLVRDAKDSVPDQIAGAYRIAYGRSPSPDEVRQLVPMVQSHGATTLCRAILNSSEFLFIP